jgi:hypothetical protein
LTKIASVVVHKVTNITGNGPIKTYGSGRICAVDGCGTRLSSYNPSSICSLHRDGWEVSSKKKASMVPRMTRTCAYEPCGKEFVTTNEKKLYHTEQCRCKAALARAEEFRLSQIGRARPLN